MSTMTDPAPHVRRHDDPTTDSRRSPDMHAHEELRLYLAKAYRHGELRSAEQARQLRESRPGRKGIRIRIGRTFIRLGRRLASEPPLEPVRPC
jgi:hypothetical protein